MANTVNPAYITPSDSKSRGEFSGKSDTNTELQVDCETTERNSGNLKMISVKYSGSVSLDVSVELTHREGSDYDRILDTISLSSQDEFTRVYDVSIPIPSGSIVSVIAPASSGKTSTVIAIVDFEG